MGGDAPPSIKASGEDGGKNVIGAAKISVLWKLLLCAQLLGLEASVDFEQLYTVPLLQTLGMPLRLVSLTGLVEGVIAMTMLPLIGWITDKGSNSQRRKTIAIFYGAGLQVIGMLSVVVANIMHLTNMVRNNATRMPEEQFDGLPGTMDASWNLSTVSTVDYFPATQPAAAVNASSVDGAADSNMKADDGVWEQSSEVPGRAGLAMFGFIVLSLGFDTMNSAVRSFLLMCTPRAEHTSLLVVGMTMASAGGLSTASLGIVDFTKVSSLFSSFEGGSLVIQTSLQGVIISILVLVGLVITTLSGYRQCKITLQLESAFDVRDDEDTPAQHDQLSRSLRLDAFESSVRSTSFAGGVNFDPTLSRLTQSQDLLWQSRRASASSEHAPLLLHEGGSNLFKDSGEFVQSHESSVTLSYDSRHSEHHYQQQQQQTSVAKAPLQDVPENSVLRIDRPAAAASDDRCRFGFKTKITLIALATLFGNSTLMMYSMTGSDFVGKAIYGGDPDAPPDSESTARYQEGMRAASWGFVVYYGTYLCFSFVHPRVLSKLGYRVEYVGTHILMGLTMLMVSFTLRLEAFYFMSIVAGFHRACFYVVPFAAATDVVNNRVTSTGGQASMSLAISIVTAMMPLAYCCVFPLVGPLEELVGNVIIPMWLGAGFCCLASFFILLLGKVEGEQ